MYKLIPAFPSSESWNGLATTAHGRIFVSFKRPMDDGGLRIGEVLFRQHIVPYPNNLWNLISPGRDLLYSFISVQAIRIAENGNLWILDKGCSSEGCVVKDSAKLVEIDLDSNTAVKVIPLNDVLYEKSQVKDMRLHREHIIMTDVGIEGLVVVNSLNGKGFRIDQRDNPDSLGLSAPMEKASEIVEIEGPGGNLAISSDGSTLFQLSSSGELQKIHTDRLLDENEHWDNWSRLSLISSTPLKGGITSDLKGNLFIIDSENSRILKLDEAGKSSVFLEDKLLRRAEGIWIDHENFMWVTLAKRDALRMSKENI